jgi:hypothetical protein
MLLRQVAEAVQHADERRLAHRALSPQSVLISGSATLLPRAQILNWQSGYREAATATSTPRQVTGASHVEALVEDAALVYLAPEVTTGLATPGTHTDIFSLGAIAYYLFSGQPAASSSLQMAEKLRETKGVRVSAVLDSAGNELEELIQFSTHPEVSNRMDWASDFVEWLGRVEGELTTPDENVVSILPEAKAGDRLRHGFAVKARLGCGSSAVALLVGRDGGPQVLKVAGAVEHSDRLRAEGEVLRKLHHHTPSRSRSRVLAHAFASAAEPVRAMPLES